MKTKFVLPSLLSDRVTAPPFQLQIAFDGNWMEAWRFKPDELPSTEIVRETLAGRETDVAVEFCFELNGGDNFFFGQRRAGSKNDHRAAAFVNDALACGGSRDWAGLFDFFARLDRATTNRHGIGQGQLCRDVENVEIGITDWWSRGDVVEIWNKNSAAIPDEELVQERLVPHVALEKNRINFVCLEFNFRHPMHHWLGIEISNCEDGVHTLQVSKAYPWLVACLPR